MAKAKKPPPRVGQMTISSTVEAAKEAAKAEVAADKAAEAADKAEASADKAEAKVEEKVEAVKEAETPAEKKKAKAAAEKARKEAKRAKEAARKAKEKERKAKAALAEKERKAKAKAKSDAFKNVVKSAKAKDADKRTKEEVAALALFARMQAGASIQRAASAAQSKMQQRAYRLSGGKIAYSKKTKRGKAGCSTDPAGKCRTKGDVRFMSTALKLAACDDGTTPTQFGRYAGKYVELMKYSKVPRQWIPAPVMAQVTPKRTVTTGIVMGKDGLPKLKDGKPIPTTAQVPAFRSLASKAKRLRAGGFRMMLTGGKK